MVHIRNYLYAVKPLTIDEKDFWIDPYLIAGKVAPDAIIGYHTALELHELAYTVFEELTFLTKRLRTAFNFQNQIFKPVSFPKALSKQDLAKQEILQIKRQGVIISVTSLERTIVDVLDRPALAGGWIESSRGVTPARGQANNSCSGLSHQVCLAVFG